MADHTSPSPIIEAFVRAVGDTLPAGQAAKLDAFAADIAETTDSEDGRRARHCAHWAIEIADQKELSHPEWGAIKELHEVWKDMWFGTEFGLMGKGAGRPEPIEDVRVEWVEDAVKVAKLVGESLGWEHAPWEELLTELLAMEPPGAGEGAHAG
jgi:hypothetical protein